MKSRSKRYNKDFESFGKEAISIPEAVKRLKEWKSTKFNQTVELVLNLNIDPRQADQAIRGAISLPHGIGKTMRVIVFCEGEDAEKAKEAGAMEVGSDELVAKVQGGWLDFDVAISHPRMMGKVGKLGRVLGPQGKMPSPKSGTVTADIAQAVADYAAGKVEFRNDSGGNVHIPVGKIEFDEQKLCENISTFCDHLKKMRPAAAKGTFMKKVCICATMSPSILLDVSS